MPSASGVVGVWEAPGPEQGPKLGVPVSIEQAKGRAGLGRVEFEGRCRVVGRPRRAGVDHRRRGRRVDLPFEDGRGGVGVAGLVGGPHFEAVASVGEAAVGLGRGAGGPGARFGRVEAALQRGDAGATGVFAGEFEGGRGAGAERRRVGSDQGLRRGRVLDVGERRRAGRGVAEGGRGGAEGGGRVVGDGDRDPGSQFGRRCRWRAGCRCSPRSCRSRPGSRRRRCRAPSASSGWRARRGRWS